MSEPVGNSPRDIPGNSHKEREKARPQLLKPNEPSKEVATKIVEGKVVIRKQPWYKKALRGMVADDVQNVGDYILIDIIVPAFKNLLRDAAVGGIDRTLYGSGRQRDRSYSQNGGIRRRYEQMYEEPNRRSMSREARARHDFDEIFLDSRDEALSVIDSLVERVERYGSASVGDLYDNLGVSGGWADRDWGWTDLRDAGVRQSRGGFLLDLPRPVPLR